MNKKAYSMLMKVIPLTVLVLSSIVGVSFVKSEYGLSGNVGMAVIDGARKESSNDNIADIDIKDKIVIQKLNTEYCDTKCFLDTKADTINFMAKTFGISSEDIYADLIARNSDGNINENNIGRLPNANYPSFERGLVEYLFDYAAKNPNKVSNTTIPYSGSSRYVENLVKYFTKIYPEVDYLTAISIGAAESGYYEVQYMLSINNIYGGMGNGGIIKYKNIEYGVLSYVKYLAENYYSVGLNSVEAIGYKYCPTTDANGNRVASPHWIGLVNKAKSHYANTNNQISVTELNN